MLLLAGSGIGFRDLRLFNQALISLAKQGWRLIYYPDSSCARLLKAKYYPRGNFTRIKYGIELSCLKRDSYGDELGMDRTFIFGAR
jgi:hypothetical protein